LHVASLKSSIGDGCALKLDPADHVLPFDIHLDIDTKSSLNGIDIMGRWKFYVGINALVKGIFWKVSPLVRKRVLQMVSISSRGSA
jgi:hypothetical protein